MLVRSLLLLTVCLAATQLLSALPLDHDLANTLLDQESEQLTPESSNDAVVVREKRTVGFLRQLFPTISQSLDENSVAESNIVPVVARRKRQAPAAVVPEAKDEEYEDDDQSAAATGDNEVSPSAEEDAEDTESAESENNEDDPRNKRFLSLGGGSGGSGGGSGNFLFDIIRLVAGSGTTQNQDEADNAPLDENSTHSGKADDGYSAGVPGPLTRLFVIANRGIANLIQDLILRLAQTTERIVNFKARLITSII